MAAGRHGIVDSLLSSPWRDVKRAVWAAGAMGHAGTEIAKLDNELDCAQLYPDLEERQCYRLLSKSRRPASRI
jgi:hypothetical protein